METHIIDFIQQLEKEVEPLEKNLCKFQWEFATTGSAEAGKMLAETEKKYKLTFSNRQNFEQVKKWQAGKIQDPVLARLVDVLVDAYTPNQLDKETISELVERQNEIENIFHNFRASLDGKTVSDNDIKERLKTETNSTKRREVWEASKQIAQEAADKIRTLAKKRNAAALKLGFKNHFEMSLHLQELDSAWVLSTFSKLEQAMEPAYQKQVTTLQTNLAKRFGITPSEIRPWHYEDPFAQQVPVTVTVNLDPYFENQDLCRLSKEFYDSIDLDISDVLARSDLFEREKKSQHAFCITMDRGQDVRVLANIRPNGQWASTLLHELGHASYSKNISPEVPYFLRGECHIFMTEAIAMMMERMIHNPHWLRDMAGVSPQEARSLKKHLEPTLALEKLVIARWVMVVHLFEKALYADPDQDLNTLWWKLVARLQKITPPENRNHPDWAAKIHIASAPVYYQNYLLGELAAAQLVDTLEKKAMGGHTLQEASFFDNRKIGTWLRKNWFEPGGLYRWDRLVTQATGRPLDGTAFLRQFA